MSKQKPINRRKYWETVDIIATLTAWGAPIAAGVFGFFGLFLLLGGLIAGKYAYAIGGASFALIGLTALILWPMCRRISAFAEKKYKTRPMALDQAEKTS